MFYTSGSTTKMEYAISLAAALAWLMIAQKDAAGLITFNDQITNTLLPKAYRSYTAKIFERLISLKPEARTDILSPLHQIAETIKKRSLIILISDLLEDPEKITSALKHFRNHRHEVLVFHISDSQEQLLEYKRETEFIDSETGERITVNPWQIRKEYQEHYQEFYQSLKEACRQFGIEYNPVGIAEPIQTMLLKYMLKRHKGI